MHVQATGRSSQTLRAVTRESRTAHSSRIHPRTRYYQLLNSDEFPEIGPIALEFTQHELDKVERSHQIVRSHPVAYVPLDAELLDTALAEAGRWRNQLATRAAELTKDLAQPLCVDLMLQYAPAALIYGCWLQNASLAANSHTPLASRLLKVHAEKIGAGNAAAHWGNRYARFLQGLGVSIPEPNTWAFAEHEGLHAFAFELPSFQLAISRSSRALLPELLGFNLFSAVYGVCPLIAEAAARNSGDHADAAFLIGASSAERRASATTDASGAVQDYLQPATAPHPANPPSPDARVRIRAGFDVAWSLHDRWYQALSALIANAPHRPHARMVALIARKAPYARGYHPRTSLQRRSLDDWFEADSLDPEEFVNALGKSPLVRRGNSQKSSLLSNALAFGGPMFRVFSPEEVATIADWIDSLPPGGSHNGPKLAAPESLESFVSSSLPSKASTSMLKELRLGVREMPLRELYHRLLNVERYSGVLPAAKRFARLWLAGSSIGLRRGAQALPFEGYDHLTLAAWIDEQHRRQVDSYVPLAGEPPLTREEVIDSSVQLCPMVFIDGAWVQSFTDTCLSRTNVGALLFQIYYDEVGNGECELNHPNVYRQLMQAMNVDVPPFGTREFAHWGRFRDSSFEVPVFWLALSQFPREFLPEILGVNLAMELSGVGGSYRQGRDLLRHYGYDTKFIELHNTIDNVSTGHTALARRAIQLHMDEMLARGGRSQVNRHWLRVWNGYRALVPPAGKLNPLLRHIKVAFAAATLRAAR